MFDDDVEGGVGFFEALDRSLDERRVKSLRLTFHPREQLGTGDALRETGAVVALGNPLGAAVVVVDDQYVAVEAAQVGGGGEAGGTGADDDGVVGFVHGFEHRARGVSGA